MATLPDGTGQSAGVGKHTVGRVGLDAASVSGGSPVMAPASATGKLPPGETLLFRANSSSLRILSVVAFAFAIGGALFATLLLDRSVHMAHMVPWEERVIWAGGLFTIFTGFFLAVWMYEKRVASRLMLIHNGRDLRLTTPTLFGMEDHEFPVRDVLDSSYHLGDRAGEEALALSYLHVKVKGRPSFVMSLNGVIPNREQLLRVLRTPH